jgi:hypothetical protein
LLAEVSLVPHARSRSVTIPARCSQGSRPVKSEPYAGSVQGAGELACSKSVPRFASSSIAGEVARA